MKTIYSATHIFTGEKVFFWFPPCQADIEKLERRKEKGGKYDGQLMSWDVQKIQVVENGDDENIDLRCKLYSARYILEEITPENLQKKSGLPMGVIVAALENIFGKPFEQLKKELW